MDDALTLLRLQIEWGADEAIGDDPVDRLRPVAVAAVDAGGLAKAGGLPVARLGAAVVGLKGTAGEQALGLASRAASVEELRAAVAGFDGCALKDTASNLVFAEGDPGSSILVIGEPPGREEDRGGHPFAGPEGHLLDQMLASIGLRREELMLTPLLPWRPPGGRPASAGEIAVCLPFLHRLINLHNPQRIVLFGATAARVLLPQALNRRRGLRGWVEMSIPGMSLALPSLPLPGLGEMLRTPPLRRDAWAGLRLLRRTIDQARGGR